MSLWGWNISQTNPDSWGGSSLLTNRMFLSNIKCKTFVWIWRLSTSTNRERKKSMLHRFPISENKMIHAKNDEIAARGVSQKCVTFSIDFFLIQIAHILHHTESFVSKNSTYSFRITRAYKTRLLRVELRSALTY